MPGSIDYNPQAPPLATDATPIGVFRMESGSDYTFLPNVRCESVQYKEGADPPSARFSYLLDEVATAVNGWPNSFEAIWPLAGTTPSPYVVKMSDELVVLAALPDGSTRVLFHGFARVPQADVSPANQSVTFVATGVAVRCWDTPINRRPQRDGSDPFAGDVTLIDAPWRFNPAGDGPSSVGGVVPNCTPDGYDVDADTTTPYPVFLSDTNTNPVNLPSYNASIDANDDQGDEDSGDANGTPGAPVLWDLSRAARTILALYNWPSLNPSDGGSFVKNPLFDNLESLLQNRQPLRGADTYDPNDPSTYTTDDNTLRDLETTNKAWPVVLSSMLEHYGFAMRWTTASDSDGNPSDEIIIYRKDAGTTIAPKLVYLPDPGTIVGAVTNVQAFHGGYDFHGVANSIHLDTHPKRYEVSFILAPGFTPTAGDGAPANKTQFLKSNLDLASTTIRDKYRVWLIDELGEGHYEFDAVPPSWVSETPFNQESLAVLFPPDKNGDPTFVNRRRKPVGTLLSKDLLGKPYKAQLAVSRNYGFFLKQQNSDARSPDIYNKPVFLPTVTWQVIADNTWNLLPDRIGIRIIADDVETWPIGTPKTGLGPLGNPWPAIGKLRGISAMSDPTPFVPWDGSGATPAYSTEPYWLRLTCVIEGDRDLHIVAKRRNASPLKDVVRRRIDCRDHFGYDVVTIYSAFNDPGGIVSPPAPVTTRDDTIEATAFARQMQAAHEMPSLSASIMIPGIVNYIQVGDRVSRISGRDVTLQTNAANEAGEATTFPYVVALTWDFTGERQSTSLQLSDRRNEPPAPRGGGHHG